LGSAPESMHGNPPIQGAIVLAFNLAQAFIMAETDRPLDLIKAKSQGFQPLSAEKLCKFLFQTNEEDTRDLIRLFFPRLQLRNGNVVMVQR
jgi:hypothetical protein